MPLDVELAEIRDFLAGHEPFASLPADVLSSIPVRLSVVYRRRGTLVQAADIVPDELLVVRSGAVELRDPDGDLVERGSAGLCLGGSALAAGTPQPVAAHAIEDTLLLACSAEAFHDLRAAHDGFAAFFEHRGGQLREAVARQRARDMTDAERAVLQTHVRDLVRRPPVAVRADEPIVEAARLMSIERISSLLVTADDRLVGILTDRDLRTRVLAAGVDPSAPVAAVMTKDPVTVEPDALAIEALLELVRRNIHHLPVLDAGRPIGMITDTDLIRLQQASPVFLVGDLAKARDVTVVAQLAARLPGVVAGLVRQGTSARDAGRVVTTVGDAVEARLLELAEAELGAPPVPYAWVTLGSRARFEQALAPDQDHALVLHDDFRPDAHAAYFRDLAERVTAGLEIVGYPRCRGDKMATNPQWRQPLAAWRTEVIRWTDNPAPQAVLEASVFFDLRHLYGDPGLSAALAATQRTAAQQAPVFLAHLAAHAASAQPPLGFFRGLVVDRSGEHRDTLDLKRGGITIVVELARLHALAAGSAETSTLARLEDAVAAGQVSPALGADLRDAWEFLAHVRLRNQVDQVRHGRPPTNRIAPASLSHFEKRHLKDAFGVIRTAQEALAPRYPLRGLM